MIDVNPGPALDLREVTQVLFGDNLPGNESGHVVFNDRGQIAFIARSTDGSSGGFISNLVAVPEPAGATLFVTALATLTRLRKNRAPNRQAKVD